MPFVIRGVEPPNHTSNSVNTLSETYWLQKAVMGLHIFDMKGSNSWELCDLAKASLSVKAAVLL